MTFDPSDLYGPHAAMVLLIIAVIHLYRENTRLRDQAMDLLRKYQERDEEERRWRVEQERRDRDTRARP